MEFGAVEYVEARLACLYENIERAENHHEHGAMNDNINDLEHINLLLAAEANESGPSAYDFIETSHTGEEIYNWCVENAESASAKLLLSSYWGENKIYPRKDVYYKVSPIRVTEAGMSVQLFRDIVKSPREVKK